MGGGASVEGGVFYSRPVKSATARIFGWTTLVQWSERSPRLEHPIYGDDLRRFKYTRMQPDASCVSGACFRVRPFPQTFTLFYLSYLKSVQQAYYVRPSL